jgi:hypothetical protein
MSFGEVPVLGSHLAFVAGGSGDTVLFLHGNPTWSFPVAAGAARADRIGPVRRRGPDRHGTVGQAGYRLARLKNSQPWACIPLSIQDRHPPGAHLRAGQGRDGPRRNPRADRGDERQAFLLTAEGDAECVTRHIPSLLGGPARSFEQFTADHAAAFSRAGTGHMVPASAGGQAPVLPIRDRRRSE